MLSNISHKFIIIVVVVITIIITLSLFIYIFIKRDSVETLDGTHEKKSYRDDLQRIMQLSLRSTADDLTMDSDIGKTLVSYTEKVVQYAERLLDEYVISSPQSQNIPSKPFVWILWKQGWTDAPLIARLVAASWIHHNDPNEFTIRLISDTDLPDLLPEDDMKILDTLPSDAAQSDLIRLSLLANHGGVWADATMLCMAPLACWIFDALAPVGFWMYHGRDMGSGPASWFIVSVKGSYLIESWYQACKRDGPTLATNNYFWMDSIFKELFDNDNRFALEWRQVPYLYCEIQGQSHSIAGRWLDNNDNELRRLIIERPAYAYKLSRHHINNDFLESHPFSNTSTAVFSSFMRPRSISGENNNYIPFSWVPPIHTMIQQEPIQVPYDPSSDKVVVMADGCHMTVYHNISQLCKNSGYKLLVYDKICFCGNVSDDIFCRPLRNVGHNANTFLRFVTEHYAHLPSVIIFLSGDISSNDDWLHQFTILLNDGHETGCWGHTNDKTVARDKCWDLTFKTTSALIMQHPRGFYKNLLDETHK